MACTEAVIASVSASAAMAQNTVSRMIIGGSTGFRMMTALPRCAPPTRSMARAVVVVNSSMFARVPGPADFEAIEATISAYLTGVTEATAATIGIVGWPPQVIMLTFGALRCSCRFTGGQTNGPNDAGVKSTARIPASAYRGAWARCARAEVASNTRSGSSSRSSSQSTPPAEASTPRSLARCSPSDDGSTPTMYRTSTCSLRCSLASKSVPMLPGPTIAAVALPISSPCPRVALTSNCMQFSGRRRPEARGPGGAVLDSADVPSPYRALFAEPALRRLALADVCARLPQGMTSITLLLVAAQHASMTVAGLG